MDGYWPTVCSGDEIISIPTNIGILADEFLSSVYGQMARKFVFRRGDDVFAHVCVAMPIPGTPYFFADPWRGYYDPYFSISDQRFLVQALSAYGEWCCDQGIIGEFMRLNPVGNFLDVLGTGAGYIVDSGQLVSILPTPLSIDQYISALPKKCRYSVRSAARRLHVARVAKEQADEMYGIAHAHAVSLTRSRAQTKWFLNIDDYARLLRLPCIDIFSVYAHTQSDVVAMAVTLASGDTIQVLMLGALDNATYAGASDLLYFHIVRRALERRNTGEPIAWICFGGGHGTGSRDSLINFKMKFSLGRAERCRYLILKHNQKAIDELSSLHGHGTAPPDPSSQLKARHFPFLNVLKPIDARTLALDHLH